MIIAWLLTGVISCESRILPQARLTASVVSAVSMAFREVLAVHPINRERVASGLNPANAVLLRGCGCRIKASDARPEGWGGEAASRSR